MSFARSVCPKRFHMKNPSNGLCSVATGYGQPPSTIYDWALEPASLNDADYHPSDDLRFRLRIEKFCDRVTRALYSSKPEAAEFISSEKLLIVQLLESELKEMEIDFGRGISRTRHKNRPIFVYV